MTSGRGWSTHRQRTDRHGPTSPGAVTAIGNTAADRRFTFGHRGPSRRLRHQAQGLVVLGAGLAMTSGSLAALRVIGGHDHPLREVLVLTVANLAVTVMRFAAMPWRIVRPAADPPTVVRSPPMHQDRVM